MITKILLLCLWGREESSAGIHTHYHPVDPERDHYVQTPNVGSGIDPETLWKKWGISNLLWLVVIATSMVCLFISCLRVKAALLMLLIYVKVKWGC